MVSVENTQARSLWEGLADLLSPNVPDPTVEELRSGFDRWASASMPVPVGLETSSVELGGVPCTRVSMPRASRGRVILYLHGGGYVLGSARVYRGFAAALSQAASAQVVVPDYRLAPEFRHPAALEDAVAAFDGLLDQGVAACDVVVGGDSSGAGLTLTMLARLRDRGASLPAGGFLLSPWVDMTFAAESYEGRAGLDPIMSRYMLGSIARRWFEGTDPRHPEVSPIFGEFAGLPPLAMLVGTAESLFDEVCSLYRQASTSGVDATLHVADGMFTLWPVMYSFLPEARDALSKIGQFVRERTRG